MTGFCFPGRWKLVEFGLKNLCEKKQEIGMQSHSIRKICFISRHKLEPNFSHFSKPVIVAVILRIVRAASSQKS